MNNLQLERYAINLWPCVIQTSTGEKAAQRYSISYDILNSAFPFFCWAQNNIAFQALLTAKYVEFPLFAELITSNMIWMESNVAKVSHSRILPS
jgi:hypothetical protein